MERPEALKAEAERARRIAERSHNDGVIRVLSDYAEELERRVAQLQCGSATGH